ncbi:MAG: hydrogenase maturation nickel metallochaperone HypA [Spirochaetales bacterium]|nr:hydrogenase maturation nickel metallochaperone HypA [Leptospiraceae bacterium]MCP5481530.1 hydrogenase maturation nickel metallochaperone HypA [Spirochaetales bacterium]MCP5484358.1 hydrogenase maturation nickel metallochaperone HypA [Spirochaetales bacterium]
MHEMSLLADLFRKIEAIAMSEEARRITKVKLKLGALAHISADHLREHFEEAAKGTAAEGCQLEIETNADTGDPNAQDILLESVEVET